MYWNTVNNFLYGFMAKYEHAPSYIKMSREFYENLEREMIGAQLMALYKQCSVRGCKIIIDDSMRGDVFVIYGKEDDVIEYNL